MSYIVCDARNAAWIIGWARRVAPHKWKNTEKDFKIIFLRYQRKKLEQNTGASPVNLQLWSRIERNSNG